MKTLFIAQILLAFAGIVRAQNYDPLAGRYLRDDADALKWLNSQSPRTVMEPKDQWQFMAH